MPKFKPLQVSLVAQKIKINIASYSYCFLPSSRIATDLLNINLEKIKLTFENKVYSFSHRKSGHTDVPFQI